MMSSVSGCCGYCSNKTDNEKQLPLVCSVCDKSFHVDCICGNRPPVLYGDQLFHFCCSHCSSTGCDTWSRLSLTWVHVIHLTLYNLMLCENGRKGFFRWNTQVCKFIEQHWSSLMPDRQKTASWNCTVAGILSVNCPSLFRSGTQVLGESGWWSLQKMVPPSLKDVLKASSSDRSKRGHKVLSSLESSDFNVHNHYKTENQRKRPLQSENEVNSLVSKQICTSEMNKHFKDCCYDRNNKDVSPPCGSYKLLPFTEHQEKIVIEQLCQYRKCIRKDPKSARLLRKLKLRQKKRDIGLKLFDFDEYIKTSLPSVTKYVTSQCDDQPIPIKYENEDDICDPSVSSEQTLIYDFHPSMLTKAKLIFNKLTFPLIPVLLVKGVYQSSHTNEDVKPFTSPYTSRVLKPFIFESADFLPPKPKLLKELTEKVTHNNHFISYTIQPVVFCYFGKHHLFSVNALISYFFWPVNLKEYLQYPDFTVVVQYGRLVIGCAFMTPDVKVSEAYIPFLLVHPDFRHCGIGKIMLYHLIQSCQGKDITLHVSVDNPAMLLYQQFGFKVDQFCVNFYDKYYPPSYHHSKHAFLMRLRR